MAYYEASVPGPSYVTPAYPSYAPPTAYYYQPAVGADGEELRTLFVSGFPPDVKEREINNMLRFLPGYEASQMHYRNGHAQGFALFASGATARTAVDAVNNMVFDEGVVLRAELAHKNMYVKDDPAVVKRSRPTFDGAIGGPPPPYAPVAAAPYPGAQPAIPGAPPGMAVAGPGPGAIPVAAGPPGSAYAYATSMPTNAIVPPVAPRGYAPVNNQRDNPPCNTLFIGNLGDGVNEAELRGLFSHQPGFQQLKLVRGPKGLSCFIEFVDIPTATACHDSQQGAILSSSDRGGIRIQYSKNPFGRKRDALGNPVESAEAAAAAAAAAQAAGASSAGGQTSLPSGHGAVGGQPHAGYVASAPMQLPAQAGAGGGYPPGPAVNGGAANGSVDTQRGQGL